MVALLAGWTEVLSGLEVLPGLSAARPGTSPRPRWPRTIEVGKMVVAGRLGWTESRASGTSSDLGTQATADPVRTEVCCWYKTMFRKTDSRRAASSGADLVLSTLRYRLLTWGGVSKRGRSVGLDMSSPSWGKTGGTWTGRPERAQQVCTYVESEAWETSLVTKPRADLYELAWEIIDAALQPAKSGSKISREAVDLSLGRF